MFVVSFTQQKINQNKKSIAIEVKNLDEAKNEYITHIEKENLLRSEISTATVQKLREDSTGKLSYENRLIFVTEFKYVDESIKELS